MVHGRNEIREKVMEKLASGHDLGLRGTHLDMRNDIPRGQDRVGQDL